MTTTDSNIDIDTATQPTAQSSASSVEATGFSLPPSARILSAAELNAIRFNRRHTLLTPDRLQRITSSDSSGASQIKRS